MSAGCTFWKYKFRKFDKGDYLRMKVFLILMIIAMIVSSMGFKKYVWFISIGYGFAICAIGLALIAMFHGSMDTGLLIQCLLFFLYG